MYKTTIPQSNRTRVDHHYYDQYKGMSFVPKDGFRMNEVQLQMYNEVLYGLSAFATEELKQMSKERKIEISSKWKRAQTSLNKWKQSLVNTAVDDLLLALLPKSKLVKQIVNEPPHKGEFCRFSFKELGVTQNQILEKFLKWGLLPANFYQIG